jgi:hypothetical protein
VIAARRSPNELTRPFTPPAIEVAGLTRTYGEVEAGLGRPFVTGLGQRDRGDGGDVVGVDELAADVAGPSAVLSTD